MLHGCGVGWPHGPVVQVYYGHILRHEKPEILRDYDFPAREIENALKNAIGPPVPQASHKRVAYYGPPVSPKPPKTGQEKWKVVVQPDESGHSGWVVTAFPQLA